MTRRAHEEKKEMEWSGEWERDGMGMREWTEKSGGVCGEAVTGVRVRQWQEWGNDGRGDREKQWQERRRGAGRAVTGVEKGCSEGRTYRSCTSYHDLLIWLYRFRWLLAAEIRGHVRSLHDLLWRFVGIRLLYNVINQIFFHHLSTLQTNNHTGTTMTIHYFNYYFPLHIPSSQLLQHQSCQVLLLSSVHPGLTNDNNKTYVNDITTRVNIPLHPRHDSSWPLLFRKLVGRPVQDNKHGGYKYGPHHFHQ